MREGQGEMEEKRGKEGGRGAKKEEEGKKRVSHSRCIAKD